MLPTITTEFDHQIAMALFGYIPEEPTPDQIVAMNPYHSEDEWKEKGLIIPTGIPPAIFDPLKDGISEVELIQTIGDDKLIADCARVSHGRDRGKHFDEERNFKLIKYLLEHKHGTPFEHNVITFRITAPLFVVQEMLRHRIGVSFNQQSHRYMVVKPKFYIPKTFREQDKKNKQASIDTINIDNVTSKLIYEQAIDIAFKTYNELLEMGVAREMARGVLPHCTYSSLYFTFNLRALLHFIGLRSQPDAQWEIRQYSDYFKAIAKRIWPLTFKALEEIEMEKINANSK